MKFYTLTSKIEFGIYREKTLAEILQLDQSYIDWCLINLNHFVIDDDVIDEIKSDNPFFQFSEEAEKARVSKLDE